MGKKKIALLSNIMADLVAAQLRKRYDVYTPEGYDTWVQTVIDPGSAIYREHFDAIVLLLDTTIGRNWVSKHEADEHISTWKQAILSLADKERSVPVFIPTLDMRMNRIRAVAERAFGLELENDWYQFAQALSEQQNNLFVYDLRDTIADMGRERFYSDKMWYLSSMPYSKYGLTAIVEVIDALICSAFVPRRKAIVLDLDNTLWGGVIGEDGIEGIELSDHKEGERYYDFQRQLAEMKKRGTLLAICSKNNEPDVQQVFDEHPYMLLKKDDFVSSRIDWNDKAGNLKSIARELNLTEGSFVFVDDNPLERGIVSEQCPDVVVPDFPADTTGLLPFAEAIFEKYIRPLRVLEEDIHKTEMYRTEAKRKQELQNSLNVDDYISKLEMRVDIHRMQDNELERVTQLCGKTNQFNLTTKRYTATQIQGLAQDDHSAVYTVHASDKYGDHGLISVIIVVEKNNEACMDTFLMSCRVMGRKLENVIINEIASYYQRSADKLIGQYVPTAKNVPVQDLYDRLGFSMIEDKDGVKRYELPLGSWKKEHMTIFKEVLFDP